jgi:hypothetical protein
LAVTIGVMLGVGLAFPAAARAEITFTDTAQQEFGVTEEGEVVPDAEGTVRALEEGWDAFTRTGEGNRIWDRLDALPDVMITIDTAAPADLGTGENQGKVLGTERVVATDDEGNPTEIIIRIRNLSTGGKFEAADTLYHELRHAEIEIDNPGERPQDEHDEVDGYSDAIYRGMRTELAIAELDEAPSEETQPPSDPEPASTPIYDALFGEESSLRPEVVRALGDTLEDMVSFDGPTTEPTFTGAEIDIIVGALSPVEIEALEALIDEIDLSHPPNVVPGPLGEDTTDWVGFGMELVQPIMLEGGSIPLDFDVFIETDGQSGNDAPSVPPFNPAQNTDLHYNLHYDYLLEQWSFNAFQLQSGGFPSEFDTRAGVVVEDNTVTFLVPGSEIGAGATGFRMSASTQNAVVGLDVIGADPTEPLLALPPIGGLPPSPVDLVTVTGTSALTDPTGDLYIEMHLAAPWTDGPPLPDTAFSMALFAAVRSITGAQFGGFWSLHDMVSASEGFVGENVRENVVQIDLYTTPQGTFVMHLPGPSETGGVPLESIDPNDEVLFLVPQLLLTETSGLVGGPLPPMPLGPVQQFQQVLPLDTWTEIEVDVEPITLSIPSSGG